MADFFWSFSCIYLWLTLTGYKEKNLKKSYTPMHRGEMIGDIQWTSLLLSVVLIKLKFCIPGCMMHSKQDHKEKKLSGESIMNKIVFLCLVLFVLSLNGFAQQEDVATCYNNYKGQKTVGYNALAMAVDNGFSVCGYAFGGASKKVVTNRSLNECESKRLDPAMKVDGIPKIMTHCRIFQFDIIEEKPQ